MWMRLEFFFYHFSNVWAFLERWKTSSSNSDSNELFDGAIKVALWWFLSSFTSWVFWCWVFDVVYARYEISWENIKKIQFDLLFDVCYLKSGKEAPRGSISFVLSRHLEFLNQFALEWYFNLSSGLWRLRKILLSRKYHHYIQHSSYRRNIGS